MQKVSAIVYYFKLLSFLKIVKPQNFSFDFCVSSPHGNVNREKNQE